ncbi:blue (type 1) copper domain-containing protein [Natrialba chahannaoensis JCM 10990]|uniref:Blue (Type 1) copper domain-containing protein n=1 Tax=Natrialba chahannaoensis JCM 10990 TaxID=1227492 RepID=M0AIL6_9EURY|nr:PQQ-dependent sugar dehydrogenase [Natrialba chahannaoensis]ELY98510.1 blue (type 1) copper domain-containing protein [Natrialba chahannaoensis JCM 10990]
MSLNESEPESESGPESESTHTTTTSETDRERTTNGSRSATATATESESASATALELTGQSRRTLLQALAATGSAAALGSVVSAQDDDTDDDEVVDDETAVDAELEDIPVAGEFPEGEQVGLQKVAEGLAAPTDLDYFEWNGEVYTVIVTQTGQVYVTDLVDEEDAVEDDEEDVVNDENDMEVDDEDTTVDDETNDDAATEDPDDTDPGDTFEGGTEFVFNGVIPGWFGLEPAEIDNMENPTLELVAGETYTFTWENGDGQPHNVVILDETDTILERTEIISEQGETQSLEFEATPEMDRYICEVHPGTMVGRMQVEDPDEDEVDVEDPDEDEALTPDQMDLLLDIEDQIVSLGLGELGDYDERGLLGIAFHPEFDENGRFYVRYSAPERVGLGYDHTDVLAEFQVDDDLSVDRESERTIMEIQQPQDNHNGGRLAFGPDGYLYTSVGDGGNVHDIGIGHVEDWYPENEGGNGQDTRENLLGGIHRIDVDADEDQMYGEYGIPDDNPLVGAEGELEEYYAWGFRNPWGMSIDDDGQLFVADAGQHFIESVYDVEEGGNYSWNVKEGSLCFSTETPLDPPAECPDEVGEDAGEARAGEPLRDPIAEYQHRRVSDAFIDSSVVVGGHRYAGEAIPELEGTFVFGNWSSLGVAEADGEVLVATEPGTADDEVADDDDVVNENDDTVDETPEEDDTDENGLDENGVDENDTDTDTDTDNGDDLVEVDERWELTELQFEGAEDDSLNRYVYSVERDHEGELYVLANTDFRPFPETGEIYKIVPADEGEDVPEPEDAYVVTDENGEEEEAEAAEDPDAEAGEADTDD